MLILLQFGILGFIIYLVHFIGFYNWVKKKYGSKLILPLIIWTIVSLNTEPIAKHTVIFFILGIGMNYYRGEKVFFSKKN